ncbi:putative transporter YDR338C-like protein 1 [Colletotrichum chlorophyti]|uniref:Putative transporter YDR338C-like protein 1 n=1 Tax=Colletotrichum chlorophyti TaxID=708187 RepID=A0A1Q8RA37_9PEZI|nr:putative transporter YDR338C-like protein 1 [Colletotrichum chlorophyti]
MGDDRSVPIKASSSRDVDFIAQLSSSFRTGTPPAQEILARDLAECSDDEDVDHDEDAIGSASESESEEGPLFYRRPSGVAFGTSRPVMNPQTYAVEDPPALTRVEKKQSRDAERSLLRDNHMLPPKHPRTDNEPFYRRVYRRLFSTKVPLEPHDEEAPRIVVLRPTESTPLLTGTTTAPDADVQEHLSEQWEAAVATGQLRTTWQREAKTIVQYASPLIVTFMLQYSINVVSIFAVGHIGKIELGAVSLAVMTATITCYAPFQGLATSLDTLCAQAYGSGHRHLVGLQLQRMTYFLLMCFVPLAVLWFNSGSVLSAIIPEPESARLAGKYLRVLILSGPAFVCFEGGKRFVQAQGLFQATTWVLLIAAPINVFMSWLFVWRLEWGFIGAPLAVVFTQNLLPLLLFLYVRFVDGYQCWGGFSRRALSNWGPMLRLALPGMIMIEAEYMAFEVLTLFSSHFGPEYLAAQSVIVTLTAITYQVPFPVSIASSTRIANLIGAGLVDAAKTTGKVAFAAALIVGVCNVVLFASMRFYLPRLFTNDEEVIAIVADVLPLCALMQVFDGLSAGAHGLLRGIGRPSVGGYANLVVYYLIALPLSFVTAFNLGWKLMGLWTGVTVGLALVAFIEYAFVYFTDWHKAARDAEARNQAE